MPFKVLNSRTVIIAGERVLSEENSNYLSLNYFYLLLLNKAWKDIPKNKVEKIYDQDFDEAKIQQYLLSPFSLEIIVFVKNMMIYLNLIIFFPKASEQKVAATFASLNP